MRVFVAGATGAIGTQLVPQLAAAGHDVIGMTRSPARIDLLRAPGARPVAAVPRDFVQGQASSPTPAGKPHRHRAFSVALPAGQ
jgi:2-alkyl-3-oxoalkanoate reductase